MTALISTVLVVILLLFLIYRSFGLHISSLFIALLIVFLAIVDVLIGISLLLFALIFLLIAVPLNIKPLRKYLISKRIFKLYQKKLPKLSETEEIALNAGDTWFEESIFRGNPDWNKLHNISKFKLSDEEKQFIKNETNILCQMIDEWNVIQNGNLPEEIWKFMREQGFFGLVIDKKYGGKGFSDLAHSEIVVKIASRSAVGSVTVMVPNSLGPGELLHQYGTQEQKDKFLPRLASGQDIPCFALTEPDAGSDATSIISQGIVCKRVISEKEVIGVSLTFSKRYITLAPVATLVGLAFHLYDPDKLLEEGKEGITCALIDRKLIGEGIGNRHIPSGVPFMNGTIKGENIFIPLDNIIGGKKMAGEGWRMLVECLSIGRAISLPALSAAATSLCFISTGAYSSLRRQFGVEIGSFEGVEEKLARIGGYSYLINACRELTVQAVHDGLRPSVASAIAKYHMTEKTREAINCACDVHAGKSVIYGPRNYLSTSYMSVPVSITVEGSNIMTRNLLIFGQGSMACHPFLKGEIKSVSNNDFKNFDSIIWSHCGYLTHNIVKAILAGLTYGFFIRTPNYQMKKYYKSITSLSYAFSFISDLALLYLGASLKRRERLSARLGDILANLYMASSILKYFKDNGENKDDLPFAKWGLEYTIYCAQDAMNDFIHEFPSKILSKSMSIICFPLGKRFKKPSDDLEHECAKISRTNNEYRKRVLDQIFISTEDKLGLTVVEKAFQAMLSSRDIHNKVIKAAKNGNIKKSSILLDLYDQALEKNIINEDEYKSLCSCEQLRQEALKVDEFSSI